MRWASTFLREIFSFLPTKTTENWPVIKAPGKPIVILVSGFASPRRTLSIMRKRLIKDGFNVIVFALDWQSLAGALHGFYRISEQLSSLVLKLRKSQGMEKTPLFIVAHSAGGLVARYYVQLLGGSHYCDGLLTLATPHRGTWKVLLGLLSHFALQARCLFQMLPFSPFMRKLNTAHFPTNFKMVSIYSSRDWLVGRATRLPVKLENLAEIQTVEVANLTHTDFLLSKKLHKLIKVHLEMELESSRLPA
ncbi:MAG: alpha/beta hydrolase [Deltaproteobacteria bacterium]|nr:alpha/beta hydrolase [Deltaproteobacteria bacterium]